MSKCPFWSTQNQSVSCNNECPMNPTLNNEETCVFQELTIPVGMNFKDIVESDMNFEDNSLSDLDVLSSVVKY